jgi:hypothetical protein
MAMAESVGRDAGDADARLAASLILATWGVGLAQAHASFKDRGDATAAQAAFLAIVDKGMLGVEAAMTGTPYAGRKARRPS